MSSARLCTRESTEVRTEMGILTIHDTSWNHRAILKLRVDLQHNLILKWWRIRGIRTLTFEGENSGDNRREERNRGMKKGAAKAHRLQTTNSPFHVVTECSRPFVHEPQGSLNQLWPTRTYRLHITSESHSEGISWVWHILPPYEPASSSRLNTRSLKRSKQKKSDTKQLAVVRSARYRVKH